MGAFFPFWSLAVSNKPIAEIIHKDRHVEYFRINKINNEFFIIDEPHLNGVFRLQDGTAKLYNGKVKIYQYAVESLNPIDPLVLPELYQYAKKHSLPELLPVMADMNHQKMTDALGEVLSKELISDPIPVRPTLFLYNFRNVDPVHIYNFYVTIKNAGVKAQKLKSHKLAPQMEAKMVFAIIVGGAIAFVAVMSFMVNSGFSFDDLIPKALKFILGLKHLL